MAAPSCFGRVVVALGHTPCSPPTQVLLRVRPPPDSPLGGGRLCWSDATALLPISPVPWPLPRSPRDQIDESARRRGICPVIPYKSNAIDRPVYFPKALYKARARIEQAVGKLKRFKRIALRCEKTAKNFGSFVALALAFILIKSVHTA